jgi:putative DNA primase/helicase
VITELCTTGQFKLLVLDNLSCLASGMKENDADEWEKLLMWLLELRRRRIAVIIVHHSGASGLRMRGTTKREDSAAWVIKVSQSSEDPEDATAKFTSSFEKKPRSINHAEWIRSWIFKTEHNHSVSFACEEKSNEGKVLDLISDGLSSASDIALELGLSKGTISKLAKRLLEKKLIDIKGRNYVPRGFMIKRNEG